MNFSSLKPKQWKEAQGNLDVRLREGGFRPPSRYLKRGHDLALEGWFMPATFDSLSGELTVWSKGGSRYAGAKLTVAHLQEVEAILIGWDRDLEKEAKNNEEA